MGDMLRVTQSCRVEQHTGGADDVLAAVLQGDLHERVRAVQQAQTLLQRGHLPGPRWLYRHAHDGRRLWRQVRQPADSPRLNDTHAASLWGHQGLQPSMPRQ